MLKILFYIKSDKSNDVSTSPIFARVTIDFKTITISTGKSINYNRWKETQNLRAPLKLDKEKMIKRSLDLFELKIEKLHNQLERQGEIYTIQEFKLLLQGKQLKSKTPSELEVIDFHNNYFAKLVSVNERAAVSLQKYERVKDLIISYNRKYYGSPDMLVDKITGAYIYNFESYLKFESEYKGKLGIKNNSIVKYFKNLKTIFNYAIKMDLIEKNPFNKYSGKIAVTEAIFLTHEELFRIEEKILITIY